MANHSRKNFLAVGVDLGSSHVRCVILAFEDSNLRFLGYGQAAARGWTRGRLTDANAITESVHYAVRLAERMARVTVESAVVGVGGATLEAFSSRGLYEFGRPRQIEPSDLSYAVHLASRVRLENDRLVLQMLPMDFTLDGRAGFRNPKGAICSRLEANVHVLTCSAQEHHAIVSAVHAAHLAVEETVFEALAAAYACVLAEDRSRGVALVDIGAQGSNLIVYDGEALLRASGIPIGGDHFTRDLAQCLKLSHADAEQLKIEYGCALVGLTSDSSLIELPSPDGRPPREATRRHLNEILEARAEELFLLVKAEIAKSGMEQSLLEGVVLTGGGAQLSGMCDMAEAVLNCQARNGLVLGVEDWPEEINHPSWVTAAGLAMYSARLKSRQEPKPRVPSLMGMVLR
ncbi:MAG: cell division protein FtsA [Bryobacteraceae bacterium]|nr:cell division protein FtsA [Bryobacteraceae bacterium]MDW8379367.1 cell division protein FtsA [Bryobacterales bacterium]